ncbi:MAG TPA: universal stress protein [Candidatus Binatia bacterium]|nr:universal stress protein [Candidatus Binatia bacterium]
MKRIRRILYATDYSKASEPALQEAVDLAKQNNAELLVVHVIEPVTPYVAGEDYGGAELYIRLEESTKRDAQTSMRKLMQRLSRLKVKAKSLLLKGNAHEQIVKSAKGKKADIIVIGTHGRTGLSKLFLGSVAGRVVSSATCPVLTVRGK